MDLLVRDIPCVHHQTKLTPSVTKKKDEKVAVNSSVGNCPNLTVRLSVHLHERTRENRA